MYISILIVFKRIINLRLICRIASVPSVTALQCQSGLTLGVGTVTGQVLLYDIRSNSPFLVKDHMYGLPIRNIEFHNSMDLVYSMDSTVVKIWEKNTVSETIKLLSSN